MTLTGKRETQIHQLDQHLWIDTRAVGAVVKRQKLRKATTERTLWRSMIPLEAGFEFRIILETNLSCYLTRSWREVNTCFFQEYYWKEIPTESEPGTLITFSTTLAVTQPSHCEIYRKRSSNTIFDLAINFQWKCFKYNSVITYITNFHLTIYLHIYIWQRAKKDTRRLLAPISVRLL